MRKPSFVAPKRLSSKGFTIIELMISIAALSMILLLVTIGIIQLSKSYYKGVIQANTQQVAREIMDSVAQTVQYGTFSTLGTSTNSASGFNVQSICIGSQRFTYILKAQKVAGAPSAPATSITPHALWQDDAIGACSGAPLNQSIPSANGRELLGDKMRLTNFTVTPVAGSSRLFAASVTIMYGDIDLIDTSNPSSAAWNCKPGSIFSSAFCGKSELTTVIGKRL